MNKAFVREPDATAALHCPRCGSLGIGVGQVTLDAQITLESRGKVGDTAFFCPFADCKVVYFDEFERQTTIDDCRTAIFPKDADAPMCACFGLTRDDIERDLQENSVERTRAAVLRAKSSEAQCLIKSASGQPCVAEVQRYYMRRKQELPKR